MHSFPFSPVIESVECTFIQFSYLEKNLSYSLFFLTLSFPLSCIECEWIRFSMLFSVVGVSVRCWPANWPLHYTQPLYIHKYFCLVFLIAYHRKCCCVIHIANCNFLIKKNSNNNIKWTIRIHKIHRCCFHCLHRLLFSICCIFAFSYSVMVNCSMLCCFLCIHNYPLK